MFTIYNQSEWAKILIDNPKPTDAIKDSIWEKTRCYPLPLVEISLAEAQVDFEQLRNLNTLKLIKTGDIFSRYDYKWDLGNTYIDSCNVGNKSSNYFHQDLRYKCDSINSPSPHRCWHDKKFFYSLCGALWSLKVKEVTSETLRHCIAMRKYISSQYKPSAALAIYDYFQAQTVLDFSSGWGDRLSAAMASSTVKDYIGIDPNRDLVQNYSEQCSNFQGSKNIGFIYLPAEEAIKSNLSHYKPDLVFTSTPYFNIERYSKDPTQSWQKYKKLNTWLDDFLFTSIRDSWKILQNGGHMAINISDVYSNHTINQICDPMNNFIDTLEGSKKIDNINYRMAKRIGSKSDKKGIFVEPIWCWKKGI